jgi:hypothetical protein
VGDEKSTYLSNLVLFTVLLLLYSAPNTRAGINLYEMTDNITAVDLEYCTMVIEVPM